MKSEEFSRLSAFLGLFIVFCANINLFIYYNEFGVNIFDYIEFSEVIIAFVNSIILIAPFLLTGMLLSLMVSNIDRGNVYTSRVGRMLLQTTNITSRVVIYSSKLFTSRWSNRRGEMPASILAFFIFPVIFAYVRGIDAYVGAKGLLVIILVSIPLVYISYIIFCEFERQYFKATSVHPSSIYITLVPSLVSFLAMSITLGYIQAGEAKTRPNQQEIEYLIDNAKVDNENLIFIGKTKGFVFLYDKDSLRTFIHSLDDLKSIQIKQYRSVELGKKRR